MSSVADKTARFQGLQRDFVAHLRAPEHIAAPRDIEDRRVAIYRDLIYNNIESFIASGFPVLRSLYSDEYWHAMVRDFVQSHSAKSPYFLQISEEFLTYLQHERGHRKGDPPFLLELAHYEWVELALDVSTEEIPTGLDRQGDLLTSVPVVSPLVWSLSYSYSVHRIGPDFQPQEPAESPTFLLVYRGLDEEVNFMEINAVTARLLQLASEGESTGEQLLGQIATELPQVDRETLYGFGGELLKKLLDKGVIAGLRHQSIG
ncbi:putative DNA-binding domain-containing protein [uncultured Microbulbifer sp.]|uniref:HvfC family RiPP maturation protein n=1 Tax=uncultured Microbulbifer sp. TaxID=348147 RepID=UPI00262EEE11|nr:putative DNA-binding domain-containing protein [uncultured Microbulbifer sp.]